MDSSERSASRAEMRVCVLVLGMHRSGASALTRVLNLLGCDLPKTLIAPDKTNETGHWESTVIRALNDEILESAGTNWQDWQEFNPGWFDSPKAAGFRDQAIAALSDEFGASRLFVLKDPRMCRLARFWLGAIKGLGAKPLVLLSLRNPLEVAASLKERNGIEPSLGQFLWLRHVLDAELATRGLPRLVLNYDELITDWRRLVGQAQSALGLKWPRLSDHVASEIESFLSDSQHHRVSRHNVLGNSTLAEWLRSSFALLDSWAHGGEDDKGLAVLDRIRGEFNAAAPAFARLVTIGQQENARAQQLKRSLDEAEIKVAQLTVCSSRHQEHLNRLDEELAAERRQVQAGQQRISHLEELVAARTRAAEEAGREVAEQQKLSNQLREELSRARDDIQAGQSRVSDLEKALAERTREADEASDDLATSRERIAYLESALAQRRHEAEQTANELIEARNELRLAMESRSEHGLIIAGLKEHVSLLLEDARERQNTSSALEEMNREFAALKDQSGRLFAAKKKVEKELAALKELFQQKETETKQKRQQIQAAKAKVEKEMAALKELFQQKEAEAERVRLAGVREVDRAIGALLDGKGRAFLWPGARVKFQAAQLVRSGLFDAEWYLSKYQDVAQSGMDPAVHFVRFGAKEGREPNPTLSAANGAVDGKHGDAD